MKLYTARISPYAARCRMQIYAKGLEAEVQFFEIPSDISKQAVIDMTPIAKIPVLESDGLVMPESMVICEYLEDRFPEPALLPSSADQKARARLLSRIADLYVMGPLVPLFGHLSRKHRVQSVVDEQLAVIDKGLSSLDHYLEEGNFAVAGTLTLADCTLAPILQFVVTYLPYFGLTDPLEKYARVNRYWSAIQDQEHAARTLGEIIEGIQEKANASKR